MTEYTEKEILEAQEALTAAVEAGDTTQVKQAIKDYGDRIDPNARDGSGFTALSWAVYNGGTEMVKALIKADHEKKFARKMNADTIHDAFASAAIRGHTDIVEALIEGFDKQIDPNAKDRFDRTALIWAVVFSRTKMAKVLIEADQEGKFAEGIDLNAKDKDGQTVLYYAKKEGNDEMVEIIEDFKWQKRKEKWAAPVKKFKSCFSFKQPEDQDKKPGNKNCNHTGLSAGYLPL